MPQILPNETPDISSSQQALRAACATAGGQKSLAARIGTTQSMVWYWLARAKRGVPGEFVLAIEAATGISRHRLRPDIFPRETDAHDPNTWDPVLAGDHAPLKTEVRS
jgi:DNA-binding transcriptional regulator YdaS (Cro superfamily)